jgi:glycosyltransferase involved in cell wall biosynthesis
LFKSIKRADAVFCMSAAVRDLVLTKKRNNEKVWILPNRINFDEMRPFARESLSDLEEKFPFQFRILHVGRKRVEKNLDTVIKALKFLGKEYCLIAVGRGTKDVYLKMAEDIGVLENCFFIDVIRNDELAQYYSFASCLCNPSRWEGFGIVFIEALACESVVVTSDIAPMNEYIRHMDNGLLVKDYESPEALAEVIKLGCGNEEIRGRIKKNARKSVERFEQRRIDNLEANYYERIMEMKMQGEFLGGSKYGLRSVVEQLGKVIIGQR